MSFNANIGATDMVRGQNSYKNVSTPKNSMINQSKVSFGNFEDYEEPKTSSKAKKAAIIAGLALVATAVALKAKGMLNKKGLATIGKSVKEFAVGLKDKVVNLFKKSKKVTKKVPSETAPQTNNGKFVIKIRTNKKSGTVVNAENINLPPNKKWTTDIFGNKVLSEVNPKTGEIYN